MIKPSLSFLCHIFYIIIFCSSSSTLVRSQDSCSSGNLIPGIFFDTSSARCVAVWKDKNFILRYGQHSPNMWYYVLSFSTNNISYGAIGFSKDGKMVGSSAIVGWVESNGAGKMKQYYLGDKETEHVIPDDGDLPWMINASMVPSPTLTVYMAFRLQTTQPLPYLIFAVGPNGSIPSAPEFLLPRHSDRISLKMDYATGTAHKTSVIHLERIHGVLNILGWSFLLLIGTIIARNCKEWDPTWFYLHAFIQTIGFLCGFTGIVCGLVLSKKVSSDIRHHRNIGILILILGSLQILALILRPEKESKIRKYWNYYHHFVGRILILFGFCNTFYGLALGDEGLRGFISCGATFALLGIIGIILEIRKNIDYTPAKLTSYHN